MSDRNTSLVAHLVKAMLTISIYLVQQEIDSIALNLNAVLKTKLEIAEVAADLN